MNNPKFNIDQKPNLSVRNQLLEAFQVGLNACDPASCMPAFLQAIDAPNGVCVLGAGKAAATMAQQVYRHFGDACHGVVVTRYGYTKGAQTGNIKVLEASHPVPDKAGLEAAQAILNYAKNSNVNEHILFLISGGGSALMPLAVEGISFDEKMQINKFLLASGASIGEMNIVRKHLSRIKGGRLLNAVPSNVVTSLIISDVVGDDPALIASGPTVFDSSTKADALRILRLYNWSPIASIEAYLSTPEEPIQVIEKHHDYNIVASAGVMLEAAAKKLQEDGWKVEVLADDIEGEAREIAKQHAQIAIDRKNSGQRCILLSGGELTVTIANKEGKGGPNQEYLLSLAAELNKEEGICAMSCDSDGVDGSEDNAGAYIDSTTLSRAKERNLDPKYYLQQNLSYDFFSALSDLVVTGPTGTNVNDFRAIVIEP